jgi:bifunctional non-homologous end joining protein LigD
VPELRELPSGLVLDGELVAFNDAGAPHWPLVVERVLHGNTAISVTFVAFDLVRVDGHDVRCNPWDQRRALLEGIWRGCGCAQLVDVCDDGQVLFDTVVYRVRATRLGEGEEPGLLAARVRDRGDAASP